MNCDHATRVLDAGLDGELDEATTAALADHVAGCPACAGLRAEREAVRDALRLMPRHAAPPRLRKAIEDSLTQVERRAPTSGTARVPWSKALALMGAAASVAFVLGWWVAMPGSAIDEHDDVVAQHVASLTPDGRLHDVASSDRHVVKPWFAGKVDFAPPVRDLSSQGFALVGGRLERLGGRPTAVIVYRIREHTINLFVSRSQKRLDEPPSLGKARGFALSSWAEDGLVMTAVSDVDPKDLARFSALVRSPAP